MKALKHNILLAVLFIFFLTGLILLIAIESGHIFTFYSIITVALIIGVLPFIYLDQNNSQFAPSRLFAFSFIIFILSRPIIDLFFEVELVQVGYEISDENIFKTLLIVSIFLSIAGISFILSSNLREIKILSSHFDFKPILRISYIKPLKFLLFSCFLSLGCLFLYKSVGAARLLSTVDYFTALRDPDFHNHLILFFMAKQIGLLWVIAEGSSAAAKKYVNLLLIFSIGFLLIGLRGYFMMYFFLFLYLQYERKKLKFAYLFALAVIILYLSSLILEYRLGFEVYSNFLSMIILPFYQQGATFEVVFGSVIFSERLHDCIPLKEYFFGQENFGKCVDDARGVPFVDGGFASSFVAEAYYLGFFSLLIFGVIIGALLSFINQLSVISLDSKDDFISKIILISILPNIVFIARSEPFDLIFNLLFIILILGFFYRSR